MRDDDDALAGIDLAAWQPTTPSPGTADAVIARLREPSPAAALDPEEPEQRPARRLRWIGVVAVAAIAVVAVTTWGLTRAPGASHGELIAPRAQHLELDGSVADLDAGTQLRWDRDRHRITAHQERGAARWTVGDDDILVIDSGGPASAATIEASGASLRVEVQMNLSDMRLVGASTLTSAAVAIVTVVVYAGHVKATSGGQTVNVAPGSTIELRPLDAPRDPAERRPDKPPEEPVAVSTSSADVQQLKQQLEVADARIAALIAELAARPSDIVNVPPIALDAYRLGGDKDIVPDEATKRAIATAGDSKVVGSFKLCVDTSGKVSSVKPLKSTLFAAYDQTIEQAIHGWTYRPFVRDGKPTPVCTAVTFIYTNSEPAPDAQQRSTAAHDAVAARDSACAAIDRDDMLNQAANQYSAGFAKAALSLVNKALACKQDVRTFRVAAMYACAAHDPAAARSLFLKVPAQFQSAIEQKCQQEGINIRSDP